MKQKIVSDMVFNLLGYVLFAVSGILLTVIIVIYYSPAVLGVFNTVFAIYILLSQICVCGQNFTILSFTSNSATGQERNLYLINSLAIAFPVSVFASILFFFAAPLFGIIFQSENIVLGMRIVVFALPALSINKVLLFFLNGSTRLKAFAVFRTTRVVLIAAALLVISILKMDARLIPLIFPIAEYLILFSMIVFLHKQINFKKFDKVIIKKLFKFGLHSMPIGLIADVNTKVGVLCLNIFMSDTAVGLYSFPLLFGEGIYQIYIAIRQVINPYISNYRQKLNYKYKDFFKKNLLLLNYAVGFIGIVIGWFVYDYVVMTFFVEYTVSIAVYI